MMNGNACMLTEQLNAVFDQKHFGKRTYDDPWFNEHENQIDVTQFFLKVFLFSFKSAEDKNKAGNQFVRIHLKCILVFCICQSSEAGYSNFLSM